MSRGYGLVVNEQSTTSRSFLNSPKLSCGIKHAFLALLAEEPSYGYELKKRYDDAIGLLWLQQAQVYNNLRALQDAGLVELEARIMQESLPDQKRFRLTGAGEQELAAWTGEPVHSNRKLKDDFYLKLAVLASVLRDGPAGRAALATT